VQDARGRRFVGPRQQGQGICGSTRLYRDICERRRHCHDLAWELASVVWIYDYCHEDNADEGSYDELRDSMFDAWDVEAQRERILVAMMS